MRLIDADALKERAIRVSTIKEQCYMKAVGTHEIDKAQTIDAVPVVRCKDCEHWDNDFLWCDRKNVRMAEDDFCSYGERRTDG